MSVPRFAPHLQILLAPWRQRVTEKTFDGLWVILVLLLPLGAIMGYIRGGDAASFARAYAVVASGVVVIAWLLQCLATVQWNHPIHARLVPGHLRVLRQSMLVYWLASALLCGVLLGAAFGSMLSTMVLAALGMALVVVALRWPWWWVLGLSIFAIKPWAVRAQFAEVVAAIPAEWHTVVTAGLALLGLLIASRLLTHGLFSDGNAKHAQAFAKARSLGQATRPDREGRTASLHRWSGRWSALLMAAQAPYNAHLRALLRAPKASAAHCLARAELVLGPPLSWATQLAMLLAALTALALGLGVRALLEGQWDPRWFENLGPLGFSLSMGALCLALLPAGLMHGAMLRTRREQSLLALLPGMPRNAELNQLLNARAVRRAMVCWLAAYGVVCLLPLEPSTARLMRAVCLGVLPVVPLLVQDWSRARMVSQRRALFIWVAVSFSIVAFFALQSQPQWTPVTCLLLSLGVTRLLYAWRYRQLARYPSAFPVGRLAPH